MVTYYYLQVRITSEVAAGPLRPGVAVIPLLGRSSSADSGLD